MLTQQTAEEVPNSGKTRQSLLIACRPASFLMIGARAVKIIARNHLVLPEQQIRLALKFGRADSSGGCNTWGLSGLPWSRCRLLRLSRGVEQFDDLLAWFHEPEGFAWPVVEFLGDRVEVVLRVDG